MHPSITMFDFIFDKDQLLAEANILDGYETFKNLETGLQMTDWMLVKHIRSGYGWKLSQYFKSIFELDNCCPRFYIQRPGVEIPFHKDRGGTLCSFNFLLSDAPDAISFVDSDVKYNIALLDTQADHAVHNVTKTRILYKISIYNKTFSEVNSELLLKLKGTSLY